MAERTFAALIDVAPHKACQIRPATLAGTYAMLGFAWIIWSHGLGFSEPISLATLLGAARDHGLVFVLVTGLSFYWVLLHRERWVVCQRAVEQAEKLRVSRLLDAIANSSNDAIYARDLNGRYLYVNQETCRLLGCTEERLLGSCPEDVLTPELAAIFKAEDQQVLREECPISLETRFGTVDGERIYLRTKGVLRDPAGKTLGVYGISRDITERRLEEERWHQWAMAFENISDGVMITDATCRIQTVNAAFSAITGYCAADAIGAPVKLLQSGRHPPEFYRKMWVALGEQGRWQGEVWNRRKNGEIFPQWLTINAVRGIAGQATHYVGVFSDVTRSKNAEAQLLRLAHYDRLTQLPNRVFVQERLEQTLQGAQRQGAATAVLTIDLDSFKTVNDSLGHPAGDELLLRVTERLQSQLHERDVLGRLGGDEFLIIRPNCESRNEVAKLSADLLAGLAAPVRLSCGSDAYVTASIGISIHPLDGSMGAMELLRDADAAMYRAKKEGRNRFCFYTQGMNAEAVAKLEVEAALSCALDRQELLLHYQPKVDALSGEVTGAEALLRWNRKGLGLVPPGQFIPVAEQSSLILDIGAWVIDEACRQIRAWMNACQPLVRVAVNVAARQFAAVDLDRIVSRALERHGVEAQWLEVEITEGMLITDPPAAIGMLKRLKALGVKLSLDDFGTGYASLAYLQHFPIDALKIDQSFVGRIGQMPDGAALVDAVIAVAHRLHLQVVAEGVETQAQRDYLRDQGCDEMQGYFFARPASAEALQQMLTHTSPLLATI